MNTIIILDIYINKMTKHLAFIQQIQICLFMPRIIILDSDWLIIVSYIGQNSALFHFF